MCASTWPIRRRCSLSMRRDFSKKEITVWACSASTAAPPDASRTVRSACSWPTRRRGHTFLDRALYLPEEWAQDQPRRRAAGVPEEIRFATKPVLARQMIERALQNGVPARWVSGDSVYGHDGKLRLWLEEQQLAHVLGVSGNHFVWIGAAQQKVSTVAA